MNEGDKDAVPDNPSAPVASQPGVIKRFIAGAVCPRCGEMDRLQVYTVNAETYKECVSCDYIEKQVEHSDMSELATRVNKITPEKQKQADGGEVATIKFYPKPPKN